MPTLSAWCLAARKVPRMVVANSTSSCGSKRAAEESQRNNARVSCSVWLRRVEQSRVLDAVGDVAQQPPVLLLDGVNLLSGVDSDVLG